jgi:hypothetical protein
MVSPARKVKVSSGRTSSAKVWSAYWRSVVLGLAVPAGRHDDARHRAVVGGQHAVAFRFHRLEIQAGVEVICPQFAEVSGEF